MKPVGLTDPRTGKRPHAVVQLRQEDKAGALYNLVGCQTKLRIGEQKRIFRSLPGLGDAVFARYGSVHRNTYVNAPKRLSPTLELEARPGLRLAGQMAGVEGYVESAALGGLAGINAARSALEMSAHLPPAESAHGALLGHLMNANVKSFQPMNVNYGLFPPLSEADREALATGRKKGAKKGERKREKNRRLAERGLLALDAYAAAVEPSAP
jgi:methylenetetrahydrofolate--tRNA-(uracil-5-)-methyltransferase